MSVASTVEDPLFTELRRTEFARLDRHNQAYLDYTGSALYAARQLRAHHAILIDGVFGNPHSESETSRASTVVIENARAAVLNFLDADATEYVVCFTANASAAIKLVGESYPFGPHGTCVLSTDNHNSMNGLREYAARAGAAVRYIPLDADLRLCNPWPLFDDECKTGRRLFAFPAQSNFSGVQHPLAFIAEAQARGFDVLLDAAAFVPSNPLSLRTHAPDFVALSFYKIFGYPTGVGALVARKSALARLARPWFSGGTVEYVSVQNTTHRLRALAEGFEDGTPDFLSIAGLADGFALLAQVGIARIGCHAARLTARLLNSLRTLSHGNGAPLVTIHGPANMEARGSTVAFNVRNRAGHPVPFADVEARAREAGVSLRGGCFCNPGASEAAFGFPADVAAECFRTVESGGFTVERFSRCLGPEVAVGAVRASLGLANNDADVERAVAVIASFAEG